MSENITALIARLRRISGSLEEYEFEGEASESAGLMNAADPSTCGFCGGERFHHSVQCYTGEDRPEHLVKAEALEEFAYSCDDDWGEFGYTDASGLIGYATVPEMLRKRAAAIREGQA